MGQTTKDELISNLKKVRSEVNEGEKLVSKLQNVSDTHAELSNDIGIFRKEK